MVRVLGMALHLGLMAAATLAFGFAALILEDTPAEARIVRRVRRMWAKP